MFPQRVENCPRLHYIAKQVPVLIQGQISMNSKKLSYMLYWIIPRQALVELRINCTFCRIFFGVHYIQNCNIRTTTVSAFQLRDAQLRIQFSECFLGQVENNEFFPALVCRTDETKFTLCHYSHENPHATFERILQRKIFKCLRRHL